MMFNKKALLKEVSFKTIRSSGRGGQNVNKVATKVELIFNLSKTIVLNDAQKTRLKHRLAHRISNNGLLILQCGLTRSQYRNKGIVTKRFLELISKNLTIQKKRITTKTPKSAIQKRLTAKRHQADKKATRKKLRLD